MFCVSADPDGLPTPLMRLTDPRLDVAGVELWLKREDLRDPRLGGNKWYKLQGHLQAARAAGHGRLLGFGGIWSNHLYALAAAGARFGFATIGVVRGDQGSAMLDDCRQLGMQLMPLGYAEYRRRHDAGWLAALQERTGPCHVIPEGGGGEEGLVGFRALAAELVSQVGSDVVVAVAMGTGTTLAGLARYLPAGQRVWGFPVLPLKETAQVLEAGLRSVDARTSWHIWHGCVDQAYGRLTPALRAFLGAFERAQGIPLDPVYTVKLIQGLYGLAEQGYIPRGTRIVALHSGGLQGRRGFGLNYDDAGKAAQPVVASEHAAGLASAFKMPAALAGGEIALHAAQQCAAEPLVDAEAACIMLPAASVTLAGRASLRTI
jgi:1-aminocyclopropane-1-carboxylate deaminase